MGPRRGIGRETAFKFLRRDGFFASLRHLSSFLGRHRSAALAHGQQQLRSGAVTPVRVASSVISPLPDTSQTLDFEPPTRLLVAY